MPGQNTATDMASIEAISVLFAAVLVWLSALVRATDLFHLGCRVSLVALRERSPTISSLP